MDYPLRLRSGFEFNVFSRELSGNVIPPVKLSHKELQCLLILDQAWPAGVPRDTFVKEMWKSQRPNSKSVDVYIFKLRRKLRVLEFDVRFKSNLYSLVAKT